MFRNALGMTRLLSALLVRSHKQALAGVTRANKGRLTPFATLNSGFTVCAVIQWNASSFAIAENTTAEPRAIVSSGDTSNETRSSGQTQRHALLHHKSPPDVVSLRKAVAVSTAFQDQLNGRFIFRSYTVRTCQGLIRSKACKH